MFHHLLSKRSVTMLRDMSSSFCPASASLASSPANRSGFGVSLALRDVSSLYFVMFHRLVRGALPSRFPRPPARASLCGERRPRCAARRFVMGHLDLSVMIYFFIS